MTGSPRARAVVAYLSFAQPQLVTFGEKTQQQTACKRGPVNPRRIAHFIGLRDWTCSEVFHNMNGSPRMDGSFRCFFVLCSL